MQRLTMAGPWLGIEERAVYQQPGHCAFALNVSFHRGTIAPRRGFKMVTQFESARGSGVFPTAHRSQIAIIRDAQGKPFILQVGNNSTGNNHIWAYVHTLHGLEVDSVDLTAEFGEAPNGYFKCSLNRTILRGSPAVLISTPNSSYVFRTNASGDSAVSRYINKASTDELASLPDSTTDGDTTKEGTLLALYHKSVPRGFAEKHNGRMYYASPGYEAELDGLLPAIQDDVIEANVNEFKRSLIGYFNDAVLYSDMFDPVAIFAPSTFIPETGERVVACKSYGEKLMVFTEDKIFSQSGDPTFYLKYPLTEVSSGHGLAAPLAIVEAAGALFYLSDDGIYAFAGEGPQKLSKGLDSLWTGYLHGNRLSPALEPLLEEMGWPWKISASRVGEARAAHLKEENLILFNVPVGVNVASASVEDQWITIVYDYINQAFSLWARRDMRALFWGHARFEGRDYFTTGANGNLIALYGEDKDDLGQGIPVAYQSNVTPPNNEEHVVFRHLRFQMLSVGKNYSTNSPQWFMEGSKAAFDEQLEGVDNTERQATTGTLELHPHQDNDYLLENGFVLGSTPLTSTGFFSSKAFVGPVTDNWCVVGYIDDADDEDRGPVVEVRSISIDITPVAPSKGGSGR